MDIDRITLLTEFSEDGSQFQYKLRVYEYQKLIKSKKYQKAYQRKYQQSEKGKLARQKSYQKRKQTENYKRHKREYMQKYNQTENGKRIQKKHKAKRKRNLGFIPITIIPLSTWRYVGITRLDYHHLNNIIVSLIPSKIHQTCLKVNHRALIDSWYFTIRIDTQALLNSNL